MPTRAVTERASVLRPEDDVAVARVELAAASGTRTQSEPCGVDEEKRAPGIIGPAM